MDPKNEATWGTWIDMEEDLGRLEAANELRIRRGEQQWEFVIPSSFTTRPDGSLLDALAGTLNKFFKLRREARKGKQSRVGRPLRELLPADFQTDMSLEEMIAAAAALEVSSSTNGQQAAAVVGEVRAVNGYQRNGQHAQDSSSSSTNHQQRLVGSWQRDDTRWS